MKALKRFYGKSGKWYDYNDEVLKDDADKAPKGFVGGNTEKKADKVSRKVSTKNGKPNTEDKGQKKTD